MTNEYKTFEKKVKKKHSFAFTPKYFEEIITNLNSKVFIPIVEKTIEKLEWDIVFQDENLIEAKRKTKFGFTSWGNYTEKISISYSFGKVLIKSISLGNEMWDNGRNSKRVKLFIHVFQETEKEFDHKELRELEKEVEKKNNWEDYVIPESLPQPKTRKKPNIYIPIIGGIILSIFLGFFLAFFTFKGKYIIGIYELGVALTIGFSYKYLTKTSNFTDFKKLNFIIIGVIISTYILNQFFLYELIKVENNYFEFSFFDFIVLRFKEGLIIKSLNTGWIGLIISWVFQIGFTWVISYIRLASSMTKYLLERIPEQVVEFAYYHFVKEKTEDQVRIELAKKGWSERQDQDEVFESIGANQTATELNRME